jgi:hypothetical protein
MAVDAAGGMIVTQRRTDQDVDDPSQVAPLLDQIDDPVGQGDGLVPMEKWCQPPGVLLASAKDEPFVAVISDGL